MSTKPEKAIELITMVLKSDLDGWEQDQSSTEKLHCWIAKTEIGSSVLIARVAIANQILAKGPEGITSFMDVTPGLILKSLESINEEVEKSSSFGEALERCGYAPASNFDGAYMRFIPNKFAQITFNVYKKDNIPGPDDCITYLAVRRG